MFGQTRVVLLIVSLALAAAGLCLGQQSGSGPIRVLLVTGGHAFDPSLLQVFEGQPDVRCEHREQGAETSSIYSAPIADAYDAVVLYDMVQQISEQQKKNFLELFEKGRGLIVLHHALASYQDWPLFEDIIGGRYHAPTPPDLPEGVSLEQGRLIVEFSDLEQLRQRFSELVKTANEFFKKMSAGPPPSTFQHDVKFDLKVVDSGHPVLTGVKSFTLLDEIYGRMDVRDGIQPLLVTYHPDSTPVVAWAKTYRNSRIVTIQPGHGPQAFQNPEFRRLLSNAIRWTVHR
jgi:type 1 glutamine amidotransferase